MPEYDTVTKISIVPRTSGAGGLTFFSPLEDRLDNVVTRHYLESQLAVAWGGRVAEELVFGASKVCIDSLHRWLGCMVNGAC